MNLLIFPCLTLVIFVSVPAECGVPLILCNLYEFGPCDLSSVITPAHKDHQIYVREYADQRTACEGPMTEVGPDHKFLGQNTPMILCAKDQSGTFEQIAKIEYTGRQTLITLLGITSSKSFDTITFGITWRKEVIIYMQSSHSSSAMTKYATLALKNKDCTGSVISAATITKKRLIDSHKGKWVVTYISQHPLLTLTTTPVVCFCKYDVCIDDSDYDTKLSAYVVDGPLLDEFIDAHCTIGIECKIDIPGNYRATVNHYITSKSNYSTVTGVLKSKSSGVYVYYIDKDEYITGVKYESQIGLYWIPGGSNAKIRVYVGIIKILSVFVGNMYTSFFGAQEIIFNNPNILECTKSFLLIYEEVLGSSYYQASSDRHKLIFKDEIVSNSIKIDKRFQINSLYEAKICDVCDARILCKDNDPYEEYPLLARMYLRGIEYFQRALCDLLNNCTIKLSTLNLNQSSMINSRLLVSQKCSSPSPQPYLQDGGLSKNEMFRSQTKFEWITTDDKAIIHNGYVFSLCWCSKVYIKDQECALADYTIHVGSLLHTHVDPSGNHCWIGSKCDVIAKGDYSKALGSMTLSKSCFIHQPIEINKLTDFFKLTTFKDESGINTLISFDVDLDGSMAGIFNICWKKAGQIGQEIVLNLEIKAFELNLNRFFVPIASSIIIKPRHPTNGLHYILIIQDCNGTGDAKHLRKLITTSGLRLHKGISSLHMKICWCVSNASFSCDTQEEFKREVAELFISGISNLSKAPSCNKNSTCTVNIPFTSFIDINDYNANLFNFGSKLVIRKDDCSGTLHQVINTINSIKSTVPIIQSKHANMFIVQFHTIYESTIDPSVSVGEYNLCYKTKPDEYLSISSISINGIKAQNSKRLVYLGKAFNITLNTHNYRESILLFLSTKETCSENATLYSNVAIVMSHIPDLVYEENGNDIMVWSGVMIKRNHINKQLMPHDISSANHFELFQKLYLCYNVNGKNSYLGMEYLVSGPKSIDNIDFHQGYFETILNRKWYYRENNILLITFASPPNTYVDCENNSLNQYSKDALFTFYSFPESRIRFQKYFEIKNSLICWCGGSDCGSISDYSTTLLFLKPSGLKISVFNFVNKPLRILYTGHELTVFDEIRVVDRNVKCGKTNASMMTNNMIVGAARKFNNPHFRVSDYRNLYGNPKLFSYSSDTFIWESGELLLKDVSNSGNLLYNVCLCSFALIERCKKDEDFRDTLGLIVKGTPEAVVNKSYLIRIYLSYSDKDHWQNRVCGMKETNMSHLNGYSFRFDGEVSRASSLVNTFISRYKKHEGFMFEACMIEYGHSVMLPKKFMRFLLKNKKGVYRMQKLTIKQNVMQDIIIRAGKIPESEVYELAVISPDIRCESANENHILKSESSKIKSHRALLFESIVIVEHGTYRLCIRPTILEIQVSSQSVPVETIKSGLNPEWINIGFLKAKEYYVNYVSDFMSFKLINVGAKAANTENDQVCSLKGYMNPVQLCALIDHEMIILSDCNNNLWSVKFNINRGIGNVLKDRTQLIMNLPNNDEEQNWLLCKEVKSENAVAFLGERYLVVAKLPFDSSTLTVSNAFKHSLKNPLDVTMLDQTIYISDAYTRTVYSYTEILADFSAFSKKTLVLNFYCLSINIVTERSISHTSNKLFCLEPQKNSIIIFDVDAIIQTVLVPVMIYNGLSVKNYIKVRYLNRPCTMDWYTTTFRKIEYTLLFVAENTTGRIIIFKLVGNDIFGYKIMYSRGLISRINVDQASNIIYITSWRNHLGTIEQFVQNKPIESYLELSFYYTVQDKYQSGDDIELEPIVKGDFFEFFYEKDIPLPSNKGIVTLSSVGLTINGKTGIVSGKIGANGTYFMTIYAGNLLKEVKTTIKISASCPPTQQFNKISKKCEECPIGTYRNDEAEDMCILCTTNKPNSTTKQIGSRYLLDCLCEPGYYYEDSKCIQCKGGTWKGEIGDSSCTGTCGNNMTSDVIGASSLEELKCFCFPGFSNLKNYGFSGDVIPMYILNSVGLSLNYGIKYKDLDPALTLCVPCDYGLFCPGGESPPRFCGLGKSTMKRFSSTENDCECDKGYGYSFNGCEPCSQFGYKDSVGNAHCTYCHDHSSRKDLRVLRLHSDLFRFNPKQKSVGLVEDKRGIIDMFLEHLQRLEVQGHNVVFVTNKLGSTDVTDCKYCISGYYFDTNIHDCFKCPYASYCPGFDHQPKRCGLNSILNREKALSPMDCTCPIKYGNMYINRNPINLSVECHQCPIGYFQHLESTDIDCLPCPENTTTTSIGSSSILLCIPEPGSFINALGSMSSSLLHQADNTADGETFEANYIKSREVLEASGVECFRTSEDLVKSRHTTVVLRETEKSCSDECLRNIYCTGYSFDVGKDYFLKDQTPYTTNEIYLYDGSRFITVEFKKCKLYFFNLEIVKEVKDGDPGAITICRLMLDFPFESISCPINHYCAGTRIPIQCHEYSVTKGVGAKSIDSCLCIPGYEPSTLIKAKCTPCNIGWYKEEVGNFSCKRCPDRFKTFSMGSKNSTDCACTQGYYAVVDNSTNFSTLTNSYLVTEQSIFRSGEEISVNMNVKINDYNRPDFYRGTRHQLTLSDPLIFVPREIFNTGDIGSHAYKITCEKCKRDHYCPGGWFGYMDSDHETTTKININKYKIHNIPYVCPFGSGIPPQSTNPSSLSHCLCLPGYMPETSTQSEYTTDKSHKSMDEYFISVMSLVIKRTYSNRCRPCDTGKFKEGQENSSCSGRCMEYATTYGGSVSESQCFCHYGRYMKSKNSSLSAAQTNTGGDDYRNLKCSKCMEGAICPGGLDSEVVQTLKMQSDFQMIRLADHVKPKPKPGYFPAYPPYNNIEKVSHTWNPCDENVSIVEKIDTEFVEFHPCVLEFRCGGGFSRYCSSGSTGYLCSRCLRNHDTFNFRSKCSKCHSIFSDIFRYLVYKLPLLLMIFALTLTSWFGASVCCVLSKIFVEFYLTMIPYGIISIFTKSSIKQFVSVYNGIFGNSIRSFMYIRIGCIYNSGDYINIWYIQRFTNVIIPLIDALAIFAIFILLKYLHSLTLKILLYKKIGSKRESQIKLNKSLEAKNTRLLLTVLLISYFVQIHFIWMEMFQMIWCVPVRYKKQDIILVLLHLPSEVCSLKNKRFVAGFAGSLAVIVLSSCSILFCILKYHPFHGKFFGLGYRKRYLGWDSIILSRRFMVSVMCAFQIKIESPANSGRLRIITSLMLSSFIAVIHLMLSPFILRNDNLFNRLQVLGICINIVCAFVIQGSFSYDFNYGSLVPIFLFGGFSVIVLWYMMVELGRVSMLDRITRDQFKKAKNMTWKLVSASLEFFTSWHTEAQITYSLKDKSIIVEAPFDTDYKPKTGACFAYKENSRLGRSGRNTVALSIHQFTNKLILEKSLLSVPNHWLEFIINYTMRRYKRLHRTRKHNPKRLDDMVITPWLISKLTLEAPEGEFEVMINQFDPECPGQVKKFAEKYDKNRADILDKIGFGGEAAADELKSELFQEMIGMTHERGILEEELARLTLELEDLVENAKQGEEAVRYVIKIQEGVKKIVDTPLTNEEILLKIEESNKNTVKQK